MRTAIGFQSPEIVAKRDAMMRNREVVQSMNEATARFNKRAADHLVDMLRARQSGNADGVADAMRRFNEVVQAQTLRNSDAIEKQDFTRFINIQMSTIQRRAMDDFMGRTSEEVLMRSGAQAARTDLRDERNLYNWRTPPN
jgi:hypothetical protein